MNSIKPYKDGYLLILGNGRVQFWRLADLQVMRECCNDMEQKSASDRRSFKFP